MSAGGLPNSSNAAPRLLAPLTDGGHRPFWSVIITLYNRAEFLPQCLKSILDQAPPADEMEIIVHDDCSPTDMRPLVERLGGSRVRFEQTVARGGLYPNVNAALAKARGHWIQVIHDDDYLLDGYYATMGAAARQLSPNFGAVFCLYANLDHEQGTSWTPIKFRDGAGTVPRWTEILALDNPLVVPSIVFRREVFQRVGLFREDLPFTADWEFYARAAAHFDFWFQPEVLAQYRLHASNLTLQLKADGRASQDIRRTLEMVASYLPIELRRHTLAEGRRHQCRLQCAEASHAWAEGRADIGVMLLRECLRFGNDVMQLPEIRDLLARPEAAAVRQELAAASYGGF